MAGLGWPAQPLCGNVTDVMRVAVSQAEQPAVAGAAPCVVRVAGRIRVLAGLPGRVTPIYPADGFSLAQGPDGLHRVLAVQA